MDFSQARGIIKNTFDKRFDKQAFTGFIRNLLNQIEDAPFIYSGAYIPDTYKPTIKTLERIGKFSDANDKHIDILIVTLKKQSSLERARTMQRNFIAWYLGSRGDAIKDAALVAYLSPDHDDWRFSLVKMDYVFDQRGNVTSEFTSARRWSFLVGANENSHTAQSRLVTIVANDRTPPTLKLLAEAFDIETVTKEFFIKYRDLLLCTKEALDQVIVDNKAVKDDFAEKGVDTVNFAKKLLGQIVFLYFLQKKGWFGVKRDCSWGSGSKHFLRELFDKRDHKNFFDHMLEPLFYEALRNDRSHDDGYYSRFDCKIPFLNGGLFDPINNYDWVHTDLNLPNALFSNQVQTREGDKGGGILDVFDRYNFTVREDEPLEKEVAIDPELLGKAYEKFNAIRADNVAEFTAALKSGNKEQENKFNKKFGVYYTPREIVHYMCQQSLIHHLASTLGGKACDQDLKTLILEGESLIENDQTAAQKTQKIQAGQQKGSKYKPKLPDSIRLNAALIDQKLADLSVCDPAVGSGAFPIGMMNEIVRARTVLLCATDEHLTDDQHTRKIYDFKRHCIEHSLYGVDIDPGAVEIAKLRLWLSLVVDEDRIEHIKPLPNLDYKVMCGNSLLSIKKDLLNFKQLNELENLQALLFNETNPTKKQTYKQQIDILIKDISNGQTEFGFELYFSEVFNTNRGFDVVIGNPPYIRQESIKEFKPQFKKKYQVFTGTADIYTYFYEKGVRLLKKNGHLCYITSNKWMRAKYGQKLRGFFKDRTQLKQIIDFAGAQIFENATVDTNILLCANSPRGYTNQIVYYAKQLPDHQHPLSTMPIADLSTAAYTLQPPDILTIKRKIEHIGTPLKQWDITIYRGVLTGFNEAFIIDTATKQQLIAADPRSAAIIKPILRGRDIKAYEHRWAGWWIIFIPWHFPLHKNKSISGASKKAEQEFKKQYPVIYNHLLQHKDKLSKRNKAETGIRYEWYAMQRCANTYYAEFKKEKIAWQRVTKKPMFCQIEPDIFIQDSMAFITTNKNTTYLIAILNSKLIKLFVELFVHKYGNTGYLLSNQYVEQLPIPKISPAEQRPYIALVDQILSAKKANPEADTTALQAQIDQLVYQLYDLTVEEIATIER